MNPITATLRSTDLCALLGVSDRSIWRWMDGVTTFTDFGRAPRGHMYALPEVVTALRAKRRGGLSGDDLARVVGHDTAKRAERAGALGYPDDIWLGGTPEARADAFRASLAGEEEERARLVQKTVTDAAIAAGAPRVERLRQITIIHPAAVRFILTGDFEELPVGDAGWTAWVKAIDLVNTPTTIEEEAA
jgi:hypothetical protein